MMNFRIELHGSMDVLHRDFSNEETARRCFDRLISEFPSAKLRLWEINGPRITTKRSRVISSYGLWLNSPYRK